MVAMVLKVAMVEECHGIGTGQAIDVIIRTLSL